MKKFALIGILLITAGLIVNACKDDVILEPPPTIVGTYVGTYSLIERNPNGQVDTSLQAITWRFTETNYFMDADTSDVLYDSTVCFCKGRGTYSVTDRVRLEPLNTGSGTPDNCDSCDPSEQPEGSYTLEQPAGGLRLSWVETTPDDIVVTNRIVLTRVGD